MSSVLSLLAYDREDLMVAALAGLMVAGAVVAIGAWLLFLRVGRAPAARRSTAGTERAPSFPTGGGRTALIEGAEPAEVPEFRAGDPEP
jgi:hypothetical protein